MRMNRRNVLMGLGTIVVGGGAALGSGAFSQVQANRTVNLDVDDDSNALLALEVSDDYAGDGDMASIDLSSNNLGDAEGLNLNGDTTFHGILAITNQGGQPVGLSFDVEDDGDVSGSFDLNEGYDIDGDDNFDGVAAGSGVSDDQDVADGQTAVYNLTLEVNATEVPDPDEGFTLNVTITADAD